MREARPIELNYGHVGEPVYDSENQGWHVPRDPSRARRIEPVGQPVVVIESSRKDSTRRIHNAINRAHYLKELTHLHPELYPAASILPEIAQVSEVISEVTANHDPTFSELLAFGQATNLTSNQRRVRTVPIIAVAAGAAGELVRLVLLTKEQLGWEDRGCFKLDTLTAKNGEEGWWTGNGSPIQQLRFAEVEGKLASWLAVRYNGAISILRPLLRDDDNSSTAHERATSHLLPSRLDANHVVTLAEQSCVPYSDVAFNPWNHQQAITTDQSGHWLIWNIVRSSRAKQKGRWSVIQGPGGNLLNIQDQGLMTPHVAADGWGVAIWACDPKTVIVACRTALALFDIESGKPQVRVPEIVSSQAGEWILDVKKSLQNPCYVFVATSLSVICLRIWSSEEGPTATESKSRAQCVLSWRHFRDQEDVSLRLSLLDRSGVDNDATLPLPRLSSNHDTFSSTTVLLYSHLSGVITVFSFQYELSSTTGLTASDPYLLELSPRDGDNPSFAGKAQHPRKRERISAIVLKSLHHDSPDRSTSSKIGQIFTREHATFYRVSVLWRDLTLSEGLYAEMDAETVSVIHPPNIATRREILKTPAWVLDDFVVSDVIDDHNYKNSEEGPKGAFGKESSTRAMPSLVDPWTINMEWLKKETQTASLEASTNLDVVLTALHAKIEERYIMGDPLLETLDHILSIDVGIVDIDKASADFSAFLQDVVRWNVAESNENENARKSVAISDLSTSLIQKSLGFHKWAELSAMYDSLIQAWISPLSQNIPGRARIALEKMLRDKVAHIALASFEVRVEDRDKAREESLQSGGPDTVAQFVLPVRRRTSGSSVRKGKEPALRSSSPLPRNTGFIITSSPLSALPTPETTPSLHSKSSTSSLEASEDLASQRLRRYASLTPQPILPIKMTNLLDHWELGADPAKYNWEVARQAFVDGYGSDNEARAKQRRRAERRRKRQRPDTVGASTQPSPKRVESSQPQLALQTRDSSQPTQSLDTSSQVGPGWFGGRPVKAKKKKTPSLRPAGFR